LQCSVEPAICSCPEPCESHPSASASLLIQEISYVKDEIVRIFKSSDKAVCLNIGIGCFALFTVEMYWCLDVGACGGGGGGDVFITSVAVRIYPV
jgi:hypothetical protein